MRAVVQRVTRASVTVDTQMVGCIEQGFLVLLGAEQGDTTDDANQLANKIAVLRVFGDDDGKMNLDVKAVGGQILVVSQFTLLGDCRKGRRPSFVRAAHPDDAVPLYEAFLSALRKLDLHVETGVFGADMKVELLNDGPVTLLLDTKKDI